MTTQSKMLTKFYKELQAWIEDGCPDGTCFMRTAGLCFNMTNWLNNMNWANGAAFGAEHKRLADELEEQFIKAKVDRRFPFNMGRAQNYSDEYEKYWQNPGRLHWVFCHSRSAH